MSGLLPPLSSRTAHLAGAPTGAKKFAQHGPSTGISAKNSPNAPENSVFRPFWACRANFFAHRTRPRGDVETNDTSAAADARQHETAITTAHPPTAPVETGNTSATKKQTENTHFSLAKAMVVSVEARPARAKVSPVSSRQSSALDTAPMHQIALHYTGN